MSSFSPPRFASQAGYEFSKVLRQRVNAYFKENKIEKHANFTMVFKTIFMLSLYFVPYLYLLINQPESYGHNILIWTVMGFGVAGIGLTIMHDANHGAYSSKRWVNYLMGRTLALVGGYAPNWKIQHNVLHHSYTNVHGFDEDIDPPLPILRFSPNSPKKPIHKLQFLYAWFFYSLMTILWATSKDFQQLWRYKKKDLTKMEDPSFGKLLTELILTKIMYYAYLVVLPLVLLPVPWYITMTGFVLMHLIAGFLLAIVFQPAHVMEATEFPLPDESGQLPMNPVVHQMMTTTNFAIKNPFHSWWMGGLNFQIEHHLFPTICHVHYPKISKIVQATAKEYNIPYHVEKTFAGAVFKHAKMLWQLGR